MPGWSALHPVQVGIGGPIVLVNLLVILAVVQVGSLFSADAWNNITFTAGEVKNPRAQHSAVADHGDGICADGLLPGIARVYCWCCPCTGIRTEPRCWRAGMQYAAEDRVATAALEQIFHSGGAQLMAAAILISTFGCANGLTLAGARVYYAMSRDGLFFKSVGKLHPKYKTPVAGLLVQACWTARVVRIGVVQPVARLHHLRGAGVLHPDHRRVVRAAASSGRRRRRPYRRCRIPGAPGALHRDGGMDLYRIIAIQAPVHMAGPCARSHWESRVFFLVKAAFERKRRTIERPLSVTSRRSPSSMSRLLRIKPMSMLTARGG